MNEPGHMLKCLRLIHAAHDADGHDLSAWPVEAAAEIERLADALMERERDARRYRWLRSGKYALKIARTILNDTPQGIDATIDAAMKTPNEALTGAARHEQEPKT